MTACRIAGEFDLTSPGQVFTCEPLHYMRIKLNF